MSINLDQYYYGKWWLNPNIEWDSIGGDSVNRPTENQALNNIALETKYISKLNKWNLEFDSNEILIIKADLEVNKEDFDYSKYKYVYRKDSNVRKVSKITGFSEPYIFKCLTVISRKLYLRDTLGYDSDLFSILKENEKNVTNRSKNGYISNKRNRYYKKLKKYKKTA